MVATRSRTGAASFAPRKLLPITLLLVLRVLPPAVDDAAISPSSRGDRTQVARSVGEPRVLLAAGRVGGAGQRISLPAFAVAGLGAAALLAIVCGSLWIAIGAAAGNYLLELPTSANPSWIDGPLKGLAGSGQSLQPHTLSAALIVLVVGYLIALACAERISLRLALAAVILANLAFTLGPTIVSTDVFGYIAYAREVALHGLDPYLSAPISIAHDPILQFVYWKHQPSPYGPLFTFLSAPLGLVSGAVAFWSFKLAAGLASIAIAFLIVAIARGRALNPTRAAIFVGLNPALLFYAVSGAHNDLLAVLLVVCGIALTLRGRQGSGAGAVVAAAAIKVTVGLALPFVLIAARRRGRSLRGALLVGIVIGVPTLLLFGSHFFDQLHRIATDPLFDTAFSGPNRLAAALGTLITTPLRTLCTAAAAIVALLMIARAWRGGDAITAAGWAFLALIASIASFAPWYLVWVLPLAALGHSRPLRFAAVLATVYVMAVHLPAFGGVPWLSQAPTAPGASTIAQAGSSAALPKPQQSATALRAGWPAVEPDVAVEWPAGEALGASALDVDVAELARDVADAAAVGDVVEHPRLEHAAAAARVAQADGAQLLGVVDQRAGRDQPVAAGGRLTGDDAVAVGVAPDGGDHPRVAVE